MAIYEITKDQIRAVTETSFSKAGVRERGDLERLLRQQIEIISPDTMAGSMAGSGLAMMHSRIEKSRGLYLDYLETY